MALPYSSFLKPNNRYAFLPMTGEIYFRKPISLSPKTPRNAVLTDCLSHTTNIDHTTRQTLFLFEILVRKKCPNFTYLNTSGSRSMLCPMRFLSAVFVDTATVQQSISSVDSSTGKRSVVSSGTLEVRNADQLE